MSQSFEHGYALLIAVDENSVPTAARPNIANDVAALHEVLTHPQRCGYVAEHVKLITGQNSTREGIMRGLDWLQEQLKQDASGNATVVIYYTGHGHVEDGSYYFLPYDVNLNRIRTSAIHAEDFAADIAALKPQRLLVMLDCCYAAGMGVKEVSPIHSTAMPVALFMQGEKALSHQAGAKGLEALAQVAGRAVLSSSQADQKSWMRKDGRMSIFTYHVIEALTGHAQPAQGAREVLVSDVMSHVYRCVPQSALADCGAVQQPDYQVSGNFPVALLLGGKGLDKGEVAPDPLELPASNEPSGTTYQAHLSGSGAIAQGTDATAVGAGGVYIGGQNRGNINTGTQIGDQIEVGDITNSSGVAIGRGARANVTQGLSAQDLEPLFAPLLAVVAQQAPAAQKAAAVQQAQELQTEVAKGKQADDSRIAKLIDGVVGMVPGAAGAVVSLFAHPILNNLVGPVTKFVLGKLWVDGSTL
jgi:hypothetical protein